MTPAERAGLVDLDCPDADEPDHVLCPRCEAIRAEIADQIQAALDEAVGPSGLPLVTDACVVPADAHFLRCIATKRRAAEIQRGRVPKVGDRVRFRVPEVIETIVEVSEGWVRFASDGGAERTFLAECYDYVDEEAPR